MSKIALFIRSLNKGGAENQSIELAKVLSERYEVKLFVMFKEGKLICKAKNELNEEDVIYIEGSGYLSKSYFFYKYLKKENFDYLFCYLPSNNIIGVILGKLAGIKFVFGGLRGSKIKSNVIKMFVQKFLLNYLSTAVISNSFKAKKTYSAFGTKEDKIHVIHNGIEVSHDYLPRDEKSNVKILSVGRFVPEKDYETSLLAVKKVRELKRDELNFSYTIVGYGEEESKISNMIDKFGLKNHTEIVINPQNVDQYYKDADVFLITSKNEGMPNVIMEAMSFSLPVVTTDAGDASYLIKDGVNGFVCPIGEYHIIAENLINLISSSTLRNSFGKKGYEILKSEFSLEKLGKKYEAIIMKRYKSEV